MNRFLLNVLHLLFILIGILGVLVLLIRIAFVVQANPRIFKPSSAPAVETAIVFGAGLRRDGSPTPVLKDRVRAGVDLYLSGKVKKLLLSGDNRFHNYNEPAAMAIYAQELGVPSKDLIIDNSGKSTYDTCLRAKQIFKIERTILVTQSFHLPRALFICNHIGIDSTGVSADLREYSFPSLIFWNLRELAAGLAAVMDLWIFKPA